MTRLLTRVLRGLGSGSGAQSTAGPTAATASPISGVGDGVVSPERCLFVIGAARSGTTILQNALNDCPDIFLFGEPNFHRDPGTPDFARRYNAMHRAWNNQENKSSFCPRLFDEDASWQAYLARLASLYRLVGAKIVINPADDAQEISRLFDFQCQNFYRSSYIFTFRNPLDLFLSTRGLAELQGLEPASPDLILKSFVRTIGLYFRALRNLPHVTAVFLESVSEETFVSLVQILKVPLARSHRYYDFAKVRRYEVSALPAAWRSQVERALDFYAEFRQEASLGFDLVQIEQNSGHLDDDHLTSLGRLAMRAARLVE